MTKVTLSTDEVVEAFCKMLEPGVKKGVLPAEDCNKYGVDVLRSKKDQSLVMLHFITADLLEVNLELDMFEVQRRGKEYFDHVYGLLCDQTQQAREVRQNENTITIHTGSYQHKQEVKKPELKEPAPKQLAEAVNSEVCSHFDNGPVIH